MDSFQVMLSVVNALFTKNVALVDGIADKLSFEQIAITK